LCLRQEWAQLSPSQICFQRDGIIWDVAVLYRKNVQWGASESFSVGLDNPLNKGTFWLDDVQLAAVSTAESDH
jgi:hypothetical protein